MTTHISMALSHEVCCTCGIAFGLPVDYQRHMRESGKFFHCPNGHSQHYTVTTVARLERELAQERSQHDQTKAALEAKKQIVEAQLKTIAKSERQKKAIRGVVTRIRNKWSKGECPCCGELFVNLSSHMRLRHPAFIAANSPDADGDEE